MNIPEKPKTLDEQVSMIWDAVYNHVFHILHWQDIKIKFILGFMALVLAILGVIIALIK